MRCTVYLVLLPCAYAPRWSQHEGPSPSPVRPVMGYPMSVSYSARRTSKTVSYAKLRKPKGAPRRERTGVSSRPSLGARLAPHASALVLWAGRLLRSFGRQNRRVSCRGYAAGRLGHRAAQSTCPRAPCLNSNHMVRTTLAGYKLGYFSASLVISMLSHGH